MPTQQEQKEKATEPISSLPGVEFNYHLFNTLIIGFIFLKSMSLLQLLVLSSQHRSNSAAICGKGMFRLI
jgi:hypothetical protein